MVTLNTPDSKTIIYVTYIVLRLYTVVDNELAIDN